MALPAKPEPTPAAIADLYSACHLPAPMVVVARDTVHFARLVKAWARDTNFPAPLFLTGLLVSMLAVSCLGFVRSAADFGAGMSGWLALLAAPWFVWSARWERGVRESLWWCLPRAGLPAMAGALALWLDGRGLREALPVGAAAAALAASTLLLIELLAPMRSRQRLCTTTLSTSGRVNLWTWLRGTAPIGPMIANRLGTALTDVVPGTPAEQHGWDLVRDPSRRLLLGALRSEWLRLSIPRQAEPVIGAASASARVDPALERSALRISGADPASLPRLLQAAIRVDAVAAAVSTFERVAVVLPLGASPSLTTTAPGSASWRRSTRVPWSAALYWLDEPSPTAALLDLAPTDGVADWFLAHRLKQMLDPALRTPALKAFGVDRAAAALRLRPVQEDTYGTLFHIGPREAPSVFVCVRDRVVNPDGSALTHWISVPPYVTTAHEAVAWTFGTTDAVYQPTRET